MYIRKAHLLDWILHMQCNEYTYMCTYTQAALFIVKVGDKKYNKKNGVKRSERSTHIHGEKAKESDEIDYTQCRYRTAKFIPNEFGQQRRRQRSKKRQKRRPCVCVCAYNGNDEENKPILSAATVAVVTITRSHICDCIEARKRVSWAFARRIIIFGRHARAFATWHFRAVAICMCLCCML